MQRIIHVAELVTIILVRLTVTILLEHGKDISAETMWGTTISKGMTSVLKYIKDC